MTHDPVSPPFQFHPFVSRALQSGSPLVALESTVITHGLPYPENIQLARDLEARVRSQGATPATIAVLDGRVHIGLSDEQMEMLVDGREVRKISRRDLAAALVQCGSGGTTVAGTMLAARKAGLQVFVTGGIGGVHEVGTLDISADLETLADTPMIVVCAGAKAILDLPATLEYLETRSVPVVGYGTDEFPAFYSRSSGLPVSARLDGPAEVARFAATHWGLGLSSAVLVCVPLSAEEELPREIAGPAIEQALREARTQGIHGQPLTPFLLRRVTELTAGASLQANLRLLIQNAGVAAEIAVQMNKPNVLSI
jgi:pseudouridine-5'-phosphate glycosidase